jgi:hypothetical protein
MKDNIYRDIMIEKIINIVQGAAVGVGFSILGYLKNKPADDSSFDGSKFLQDVISGAVAGGILGFANVSVDLSTYESSLISLSAYGGLTVVIERASKAIWRYLQTKVPSVTTY